MVESCTVVGVLYGDGALYPVESCTVVKTSTVVKFCTVMGTVR